MKRPAETAWVKLAVNMEIPEGARVRTKLGTRVVIVLNNGSTLTLHENSIFEVIKSAGRNYDFRLWIGDIRSHVQPIGAGGSYTIRTAVAVAGVRGTDFLLSASDEGRTELSVYEGRIAFASSVTGQQAAVGANQSCVVEASGQLLGVDTGVRRISNDDNQGAASSNADAAVVLPLVVSAPQDNAKLASREVIVMGTTSPGGAVKINGRITTADRSGYFSSPISLAEGANVIVVSAGADEKQIRVSVDSLRPTIEFAPYSVLTNRPAVSLTVLTKDNVRVAAGGISTLTAGGAATLQLSLSEGENIVNVTATDAGGLSSEKPARFILDSIAPPLTIASVTPVANGMRISGLTEASRDQYTGASVLANGYPLDVRSDGTFDQVISNVSAGDVTFEASDRAGNVTRDVRNISGTVDGAAPVLVSLFFSPSTSGPGDIVNVTMNVSDASALAPATLTLVGPSGASLSCSLSPSAQSYSGTLSIPPIAASGSYVPTSMTLADILGNSTRTTPSTALVVSNAAPSSPSGFSAVDQQTGGSILLTWGSVSASDFRDYTVNQGSSSSGPWSAIYNGTGNSQSLSNLVNGTTYFYQVLANDLAGNASSPAFASARPSDQVAPTSPSITSASGVSSSEISLGWTAVADGNSYKVYRSLSAGSGGPWAFVAQVNGTGYVVTGLSPTTTYFFAVTALDNNTAPPTSAPNESARSGAVSATTL